jgi:hypothetical protein
MKRREFAKKALGAAAAAPILLRSLPQQPQEAPKAEPRVKLTPEQEEAVKKATDNRERQLGLMRKRVLPFDLEPAFVFAAKSRKQASKQVKR